MERQVYLPYERMHCGVTRDEFCTFLFSPTWWVCQTLYALLNLTWIQAIFAGAFICIGLYGVAIDKCE